MSFDELSNISDDLSVLENDEMIKIQIGDLNTGWLSRDDTFLERISPGNLNRFFRAEHLRKEIEIKNTLDEGIEFLNSKRYPKAVACFDKVLYFDENYSKALYSKSLALYAQGHFVNALRFYKKSKVEDLEYHRMLLEESFHERDNFPKIKRNIYAGDEAAVKGDFKSAVEFYTRALDDSSRFKNRILFKLLNKKAFSLIELERFDEALASFDVSVGVHENDPAYFGRGYCQYKLGFECAESLRRAVLIDKKRLLLKAGIFNELGFYKDGLESYNTFLDNHFAVDSDFKTAIKGKLAASDNLGLEIGDLEMILKEI